MSTTRPSGEIIAESRAGALQITLWANDTKNGGQHLSATLRPSYRHGEQWREVKMSIPLRDLLPAAELCRQMHAAGWAYSMTHPSTPTEQE